MSADIAVGFGHIVQKSKHFQLVSFQIVERMRYILSSTEAIVHGITGCPSADT